MPTLLKIQKMYHYFAKVRFRMALEPFDENLNVIKEIFLDVSYRTPNDTCWIIYEPAPRNMPSFLLCFLFIPLTIPKLRDNLSNVADMPFKSSSICNIQTFFLSRPLAFRRVAPKGLNLRIKQEQKHD